MRSWGGGSMEVDREGGMLQRRKLIITILYGGFED